MAIKLTTEAELAAELGKPLEWVSSRRRRRQWPHIRLGRFDVRYTDAQIEEIVAMYEVSPATTPAAAPVTQLDGQTKRSAARSAS